MGRGTGSLKRKWRERAEKRIRTAHLNTPAASAEDRRLDRAYRPCQIRIFAATWLAYAGYYYCRKLFYVVKAHMAGALGFTTVQPGHLGTAYLAAALSRTNSNPSLATDYE
ncbi:MAG TPA: hypothetical protein VNY05_28455 [Candidatus Acidoferrales bacterium]|nr:hypothetical protein [Candidatus Acidoferrales bacterium]